MALNDSKPGIRLPDVSLTRRRFVAAGLAAAAVEVPAQPLARGADAISSAAGKVDPAQYRAMAKKFASEDGIAYRYGAPTEVAVSEQWWEPPSRPMPMDKRNYQVGTWKDEVGDFASNWGHVLSVPDAGRIGVTDLLLTSISNSTLTERPALPWVYYGEGLDARPIVRARDRDGQKLTRPVAMARSHGRPGWGVTSIVAFEDGLLLNLGTNTQSNRAHCRLPPGLVPTAIALSNSNEFAFVTVWDPARVRGGMAVVALCGMTDGSTIERPKVYDNWGEWTEPHPGLSNLGNITYMKYLGLMDLPEAMVAPTEISVTTGADKGMGYISADTQYKGSDAPFLVPLSVEANRRRFVPGGNLRRFSKTQGSAWIISKSEKFACLVDISPLLRFYDAMYFSDRARFDQTRNIGDGPGQWPYTFAKSPQQLPRVARTVQFTDRPTAVRCYQFGDFKHAWVATEDGTVRQYGISSGVEEGSVRVGRNPTGIEYAREKAQNKEPIYADYTREIIVTSRAEHAVQWVRWHEYGGEVVRTLRDRRIRDPITTVDLDNHGSELYVVAVADYSGRAVRNYRYGALNLEPGFRAPRYGMGPDGGAPFEYGGGFDMPGKPFALCSSNTS